MRTLIIDNHDSFTYNLYQLMASVYRIPPVVLRNDDPALARLDLDGFDAIVVSPGPGRPDVRRDFGYSRDVLAQYRVPVLGVCLGHQGLGQRFGTKVIAAPRPRHGYVTRIRHTGSGLFAGIPQDFAAVRYHSLCLDEPLAAELEVLARAEDGVVMAIAHRHRPQWGVQFHPESVATEHGRRLFTNLGVLVRAARPVGAITTGGTASAAGPVSTAGPASSGTAEEPAGTEPAGTEPAGTEPTAGAVGDPARTPPASTAVVSVRTPSAGAVGVPAGAGPALRAYVTVLPRAVDTATAYQRLYRDREYAFWLDSSEITPGLSRFSFLGAADGPDSEVLTYRVGAGAVTVHRADGGAYREPGNIFEVLDRRLAGRSVTCPDLPFDFAGGYVGYLGYELKADAGAGPNRHVAATPDAIWLRVDRFVAVDHLRRRTYLVALGGAGTEPAARRWLTGTARALRDLPADRPDPAAPTAPGVAAAPATLGAPDAPDAPDAPAASAAPAPPGTPAGPDVPLGEPDTEPWLSRSRDRYLRDIAECQRELAAGESYEICLTNQVRVPAPADDLDFYLRLRRVNPAPYAALLRFGELAVHSSSPERFLRIDPDRTVESKPIKGTAPRHPDPVRDEELRRRLTTDPKTRAENLMIVDLLRNDLGRVCEVDSVRVPSFLATESYATMHQLVSTIRGRLQTGVSAPMCARACFPGGSMTGAPKLRSMEIIDRLETHARGIYSGALGYFSYTGTADLSIVIRTAVRHGDQLAVGAGGAIVLDSDPHDEYAEMLLKARATLRALSG